MDEARFDGLIKRVTAVSTERRGAIKSLVAAALALVDGERLRADTAAAKRKRKRKRKKRKPRQSTPGGCRSDCSGKECGADGCGGSCGGCPPGSRCSDGACETVCTRNCVGKNCGSDGCGGSCGTCGNGFTCSDSANGGTCRCPSGSCSGVCCGGNQTCVTGSCCPNTRVCAGTCCASNQSCVASACCATNRVCGNACCTGSQTCLGGSCCPNAQVCNGTCCTANQTCLDGQCCPSARICNGACCGSNATCIAGQCCPDARACGSRCCSAGQACVSGACRAAYNPDAQELAFLTLINDHRRTNNRQPLALQDQLGIAAELHSQDQAARDRGGHDGSDGSNAGQRISRAGYDWRAWGENVFWSKPDGSAQAAFDWWRNSPGHNANMLSSNFTEIGIGRARSASGWWYWTTTFGDR